MSNNTDVSAAIPKPTLSITDAVAITVGIVVGAGIFKTPSMVAGNAGSEWETILIWLAGGAVSLVGALCYAELVTAYPNTGGDYFYLQRAFGPSIAFLFVWGRIAVIQTGSIALLALVFGDYTAQLIDLGAYSSSIYAAIIILILTALNISGVRQGSRTQNLLTALEVTGLVFVIITGLLIAPAVPETVGTPATENGAASQGSLGLAMVFVLLTYGGWNEAAYVSAELRGERRRIAWALILSIGVVTALYVLVNLAYINGLGLRGMATSEAVGADLMKRAAGQTGVLLISVLVAVSALTSANASIITGARTTYALGRDYLLFGYLGRWNGERHAPVTALVVQGIVSVILVIFGTLTREGFSAIVEYTAPVFWFFFFLTGLSLIVLRKKDPATARPFRVPLYPLTPILFCASTLYMLRASLAYTKIGALVGVIVLLTGVPVLFWARLKESSGRELMRRETL